jgi:hypothetical protein
MNDVILWEPFHDCPASLRPRVRAAQGQVSTMRRRESLSRCLSNVHGKMMGVEMVKMRDWSIASANFPHLGQRPAAQSRLTNCSLNLQLLRYVFSILPQF